MDIDMHKMHAEGQGNLIIGFKYGLEWKFTQSNYPLYIKIMTANGGRFY